MWGGGGSNQGEIVQRIHWAQGMAVVTDSRRPRVPGLADPNTRGSSPPRDKGSDLVCNEIDRTQTLNQAGLLLVLAGGRLPRVVKAQTRPPAYGLPGRPPKGAAA